MKELVELLGSYGPGVVALLALAAGCAYVLREVTKKVIERKFDRHPKQLDLALALSLAERLERILTNVNRMRSGQDPPQGFLKDNEIIPLSRVFEELSVRRVVLGEGLHGVLEKQARLVFDAANATAAEWQLVQPKWAALQQQLRDAVDRAFRLGEVGHVPW